MSANLPLEWVCQPKAEALVARILEASCNSNPFIQSLQRDLSLHTSTRLFDWLDHVVVGSSPSLERELEETGFVSQHATPSYRVFYHPGAQLPRIVVRDKDQPIVGIAVAVESIADFLMAHGMTGWIEGVPFSGYRRCSVSTADGVSLWVIERRDTELIEPTYPNEGYLERYLEAVEKWQTRPRSLHDEDEAIHRTLALASELVNLLGQDLAAWVVLECERKYWQARNGAGQLQKNRQDRLGMGWANHDHHTFRSSRRHFPQLVRLFEMLGFYCRERFYAGEEAGWGAQVMENPRCKLVLFLDVDLAHDELEVDFAHHAMPELEKLGTIGLWCAMHGASILKGGMHHLEAQFSFDSLTHDLGAMNVRMMEPFSNFSYLKQAFTEGEVWHVEPWRVQKLLTAGKITGEQADKFLAYGAVGSHMENLQRREGYKGFNQKNVSYIIKKTDPRLNPIL
ncbi:MAG: hypothetical protein LLG04_14965 [Parachlamydia sp.]|nr:hypothetical protein [Parachlamydia sp.]